MWGEEDGEAGKARSRFPQQKAEVMGRARGSSKPLPFSEWPEEAVLSPSPHVRGGGRC